MTPFNEYSQKIAISASIPEKISISQSLAKEMTVDWLPHPDDINAKNYDVLLIFTENYLGLRLKNTPSQSLFYIDFLSEQLMYRAKQAGLRKELLAKAIGQKPATHPNIVDATAGLGRDSFILATLGFEITLIERSPVLYQLLKDALARAALNAKTAPMIARMHLIFNDAHTWLHTLLPKDYPDIIYLDPMFPPRKKSASVKKEMVILQNLLGKGDNVQDLLQTALACAKKRVVVKRPRLVDPVSSIEPHFSLEGKSSRFDVYLTHQSEQMG